MVAGCAEGVAESAGGWWQPGESSPCGPLHRDVLARGGGRRDHGVGGDLVVAKVSAEGLGPLGVALEAGVPRAR